MKTETNMEKYILKESDLVRNEDRIHHIRVNGKPYCQQESVQFQAKLRYPTNCAHANKVSAEEGVLACKSLRPDLDYEIVPGRCGDDPFWKTPEGIAIQQQEYELQEMRWS
jgi:hypothetical protein